MKKLFLFVAALCASFTAAADEGMWLLPYLQKMNIATMQQRGCKLSAEEIYSADKSSLKDAIVIFGGGCTGEIVSHDGLLFTNHHCGFDAIQSLSAVEHDYLKNGFWAMNNEQELPAPGLEVRFIRQIIDVTPQIVGNIPSTAAQQEFKKISGENLKATIKELEKKNPGMEVIIPSFFEDNQYFAFVMEVYTDIRLVGTPPSSIGKFGGDTDNWMWPRHTGDFSIFRVYAGKDNRPAAYSPENRPYNAEKFLKVSLKGIEENDFAMIMGFPGSTERFATSYELNYMLDVDNPQRIFIRGEKQKIWWEDMMASDKVRIQYASKYARSSNYWKNSIGMSKGIRDLKVVERKQAQEASFQKWADENTMPQEGYQDALKKIAAAQEQMDKAGAAVQYLREAFYSAVELITPASIVLKDGELRDKKFEKVDEDIKAMTEWFKDYNVATDRKVAKRMLTIARENMAPEYLPSFYTEIVDKEFGGDIDKYVDYLYDNTQFTSEEKVAGIIRKYNKKKVAADPALPFVKSVREMYKKASEEKSKYVESFAEGRRKYVAGLMLQHPDKAWASDANFTIRLTYGRVLPYEPKDGVLYRHYTTLKGVMQKEDKNNPAEFFVPEKLKELYAAQDYGQYANSKGELPVAFLADCDITGGNSGSPMMNANGELIGLAFDGNWEAMSGDVAFEPELQRTIGVDVRYVLFIIDKFAGAGWLLDEMEIVK